MARPASAHPTDGELEILKVLWETGPAELGTIRTKLSASRPVASTTVATMLKIMLTKGLVKRAGGKRGYLWSARVGRTPTARRILNAMLDRLFDGSAQRLIAHLLESGNLSEQDRREIRRMLDQRDNR